MEQQQQLQLKRKEAEPRLDPDQQAPVVSQPEQLELLAKAEDGTIDKIIAGEQ